MDIVNSLPSIVDTTSAASRSTALIRVSGTAATTFLQGQLTCDIQRLAGTKLSSLGAHCNTKGRVRALYRVFQRGADFYLRCPNSLLDKALSFLQFYARFSKVSLTPIENLIGFGVIACSTQTLPFSPLEVNEVAYIGDYVVLRVPGTKEWDRYEIYMLPDANTNKKVEAENTIKTWLATLPSLPEPENAWVLSDILAGIPDIFLKTSEQFLPHYIGLPQLGAISFTKGCYIGQEIIARMEYRSKQQKYRLALIKIEGDSPDASAEPGDVLPAVGTVISLAQAPDHLFSYALVQTAT